MPRRDPLVTCDLFRSRHRSARRSCGAPRLIRVVPRLALITFCALLAVACGESEITRVNTEAEAFEILSVLDQNNIDAHRTDVGEGASRQIGIAVDQDWFGGDEVVRARQVLKDNGLPRPTDKGLEGAYENSSLMPSESAEAARRLKERETEVERQLRKIVNVVDADVNIAPADNDPLNLDKKPASASVLITYKEPKFIMTGEDVQRLVAGAVTNLPPERVTVTLQQYAPRPAQSTASDARRRRNLLIAGGVGLLVVLGALGLVYLLQTRRHRARSSSAVADADDARARLEDAGIDDARTQPASD